MTGDLIRIFIAIEVRNEEVLKKLVEVRDAITSTGADVKPVEDENIHLTLRFIGEVPKEIVDKVCNLLSNVEFPRFEMRVKGLGVFPSINRPRVIWAGVSEGSSELTRLYEIVEKGLRALKIPGEREEFTPHITLARVKSGRGVDRLVKVIEAFRDYDFGITIVDRVVLKKSTLTPRGPIYNDVCFKEFK
ncbi:MAG: RNA 2',3'-cyclic phosphodiesterase [Thermosphaera sp.]